MKNLNPLLKFFFSLFLCFFLSLSLFYKKEREKERRNSPFTQNDFIEEKQGGELVDYGGAE